MSDSTASTLAGIPSFISDLFAECSIPVRDGDGSCATNGSPHGGTIRNLVRSGIKVRPIALVHYASVHYLIRDCGPARRIVRAFDDLAGTMYRDADTQALHLRASGDHEWTGAVSQVLGVGLATLTMCKALPAKLAEITRITSTGKRCDFRVVSGGFTAVYEARGRNIRSQVLGAAKDLDAKKAAHVAHYKYGVISALPNDGQPVELFIFDPPGDENLKPPSTEERYLQFARHYRSVAALAGMATLADAIKRRSSEIAKTKKWISGPIVEKMPKFRGEIQHEGRTFLRDEHGETADLIERIRPLRLEAPGKPERRPEWEPRHPVNIEFGLDAAVVEALNSWEFEKLFDIPLKTHAQPNKLLHVAEDGSLLRVIAS